MSAYREEVCSLPKLLQGSAMATSRLNMDVLANVCEFLTEVSDLLSVSLTCSSMHVVAVRWLLLTRRVYLNNGPSIRHFHSFLFADAPARAPHVRTAIVNLAGLQPAAADFSLLLNILTSCQNIEHITVAFQKASMSIVMGPHFIGAINDIPVLRSFNVRSESFDAAAPLHRLRKPVPKLGIHSSTIHAPSRYPGILQDVLPRVVVQTLQELELEQFTVDLLGDAPAAATLSPVTPVLNMRQYPAVHSLLVGLKDRPLLNNLQHLFPALDGTLSLGGLDMRMREERYANLRARNQRSQESDGDGGPSRAWKKLDRIVCDAAMLYVLGLRCPIRLAMIDPGLVHQYLYDRYLADALRENPVARLKLTLDHDLRGLDGLFSPELARTLTHLTLCLFYSNDYASRPQRDEVQADTAAQRSWDSVLDAIVSAIQPLRNLTHLRIVVGASVYVHESATRTWPFAPWEEYAHSFRASSFDWEGTAATLARVLPSSQNVFLTTGGFLSNWDEPAGMENAGGGRWKPYERWYITHGWRIANAGTGSDGAREGERALVELHVDVAETMIRNEELVLSRLDEAALQLNYGWGRTPPSLSV